VDMDKFGKGKIADIKRREKVLSKIEQAEMASEFATKASEKIYKTTMNALMGNVQEGLKNSDPSIDEDLKTKPKSSTTIATKVVQQEPSSFLEKKENIVESDILIKQESQTVDKVLNSIAKRKKRRHNNNMRSSNGGKKNNNNDAAEAASKSLPKDPSKDKASTLQIHKFPRHTYNNVVDKWHKEIKAHDNLEELSKLAMGIHSTGEKVEKTMELPNAADQMKNLKLTLKDEKKMVQTNILANDMKRGNYDRLRVRNVQAKAALATAEQKLNDANVMLPM
jgi:hypothetical protein